MYYADDAGIVSKSAEGLAKTTTVIVTVFEAAGLTESETKTETMLLQTPDPTTFAPPIVIEAVGQRYKQTAQFLYLGGNSHENVFVFKAAELRFIMGFRIVLGLQHLCVTTDSFVRELM